MKKRWRFERDARVNWFVDTVGLGSGFSIGGSRFSFYGDIWKENIL